MTARLPALAALLALLALGSARAADPPPRAEAPRPIRVLLFADGPNREFQFLRGLLAREAKARRVELSVYLQSPDPNAKPESVGGEIILSRFPKSLRDSAKPEERADNLASYDVLIAIDPDWAALEGEQLANVERWVDRHGGGLILVAGALNTNRLARSPEKLKPIRDVLPVVVDDVNLRERPGKRAPRRLTFPGAAPEMDFLRLDADGKEPLSGWERFFTGKDKPERGDKLLRGFSDYHPVKQIKPAAIVVARIDDPKEKDADGRTPAYMVTARFGQGRTVWIGSPELWRLRAFAEGSYDRFWLSLIRYAGGERRV